MSFLVRNGGLLTFGKNYSVDFCISRVVVGNSGSNLQGEGRGHGFRWERDISGETFSYVVQYHVPLPIDTNRVSHHSRVLVCRTGEIETSELTCVTGLIPFARYFKTT